MSNTTFFCTIYSVNFEKRIVDVAFGALHSSKTASVQDCTALKRTPSVLFAITQSVDQHMTQVTVVEDPLSVDVFLRSLHVYRSLLPS